MGDLHTLKFSPDSGSVLIVGGEKEEMVRIYDIQKFEKVCEAFRATEEDAAME